MFQLRSIRSLSMAALVAAAPLFAGCDANEEEATTTISGKLSVQAGVSGTPDNARVLLFLDLDDPSAYRTTAADAQGNFRFEDIQPNAYYLAAYKDLDNNGLDEGDLYGEYLVDDEPVRVEVKTGENKSANFRMEIF